MSTFFGAFLVCLFCLFVCLFVYFFAFWLFVLVVLLFCFAVFFFIKRTAAEVYDIFSARVNYLMLTKLTHCDIWFFLTFASILSSKSFIFMYRLVCAGRYTSKYLLS